jgi:hypothetical protein
MNREDPLVVNVSPLVCQFCKRTDGGPFYMAWKTSPPVESPPMMMCKRCLLERGVELPPERGVTARCDP